MNTPSFGYIFYILTAFSLLLPVVAQPPSLVNFRGQLLDNNDQPINDTVYIDLHVYSSESGGTSLYSEVIGNVDVKNGQYAFQFGATGTPGFAGVIQANAETWIEVSINDSPLPRQRFVSVPYALSSGSSQIAPGSITRETLSDEIRNDLNRSIEHGSITREMLDADLNETISMGLTKGSLDIQNPFGWDGEFITYTDTSYTVPNGKVLVIVSGLEAYLGSVELDSKRCRGGGSDYSVIPSNTQIYAEHGWTGFLVNPIYWITATIVDQPDYEVPVGKTLVVLSSGGYVSVSGKPVFETHPFGFIESGKILNIPIDPWYENSDTSALSGYLIDENHSFFGGDNNSNSQSDEITPDMLSDSILKYLSPEIVEQPTFINAIDDGVEVQLEPNVEGKYLTYQWYKNGEPIEGATTQLFTIESFDVGYHDGNYTVVVANDFGSVESQPIELVYTHPSIHIVELESNITMEMLGWSQVLL